MKPLPRFLVGSEPETAEDYQRRQNETVRRLRIACENRDEVSRHVARRLALLAGGGGCDPVAFCDAVDGRRVVSRDSGALGASKLDLG
jgi:hypothetical protein